MITKTRPPQTLEYPPVYCWNCRRFNGGFVGRSQCPSCSRWIDVPLPEGWTLTKAQQ